MKNNLLAICLALCALMLANRVSAQMGDTIIHLDDNIICACPPEFKEEFKMTAKQLVSEMNFYIASFLVIEVM